MSVPSTWQKPAELAAELRPHDPESRRTRWVERLMQEGVIPSIKVGRFRYFTPECRRQMEREQLRLDEQPVGWDRVTRKSRRAS